MFFTSSCKKSDSKVSSSGITHVNSQFTLVTENTLPDYTVDQNGNIGFDDAMAADNYGNVYLTNTSNALGTLSDEISGIAAGYLDKFDVKGNITYTKSAIVGGSSYQPSGLVAYNTTQAFISVDSLQNVYIGYFSITHPWNCVSNAVKYNSSGDTIWSKHISYTIDALMYGMWVANNGTLYIASNVMSNPVDTIYYYNYPNGSGSGDMLYTFNQAGKLSHVSQITPFSYYQYNYQPISSGNFYEVKYSNSPGATITKYGPNSNPEGSDININIPPGGSVIFDRKDNAYITDSISIAKLSVHLTTTTWSIATQKYKLIKTDGNGNVYICGTFNGTVNFNPLGTPKNLTANGQNDTFLEKFDSTGKMVWVTQSLGVDGKTYTGSAVIDNFIVNSQGSIFVTGSVLNIKTNLKIHFGAMYSQPN